MERTTLLDEIDRQLLAARLTARADAMEVRAYSTADAVLRFVIAIAATGAVGTFLAESGVDWLWDLALVIAAVAGVLNAVVAPGDHARRRAEYLALAQSFRSACERLAADVSLSGEAQATPKMLDDYRALLERRAEIREKRPGVPRWLLKRAEVQVMQEMGYEYSG